MRCAHRSTRVAAINTQPTTLADVVRELREIRDAMQTGQGQLLTADEAAAFLGIGRTKFFELVQLVPLPPVKLPGAGKMWRRSDLAEFVANLPSV